MLLFASLTIWFFLLMLFGLMQDTRLVTGDLEEFSEKRRRNYKLLSGALALISLLVLWLLTAFRAESIGNDTHGYLAYFQMFNNLGPNYSIRIEKGYQFLNILIGKLTSDYHVFLIVISTMLYLALAVYLFLYSPNILLSVCLFFCAFFSAYTNVLRQALAMIITLYGYQALKGRKHWLAALLFLLAMFFHKTAFICFLLFLSNRLVKKKWLVFALAALCAAVSASGALMLLIHTLFPQYSAYFNSEYVSTGWLAVTYSVAEAAIFYWLACDASDASKREDCLALTSFALFLLITVFGYSINLITRVGQYFEIIAITELPEMLLRRSLKHGRVWMFCICTVLLIMFMLTLIYRPEWNHLVPYEFWHYE